MTQRKIRTTTTIPEDIHFKFRAIAVAKYEKNPYQRALCEAMKKYIDENKDILRRLSE